ncbi:winged helix-turn-helix domain-containing protein [Alkalicoccobacillus porphyridii]|nr:response regulator transcription factor [Alkalicoccobacillus porphyridii]
MGRARILIIDNRTLLFEQIRLKAEEDGLHVVYHKPGINTNEVVEQQSPQLVIIGSELMSTCQVELCKKIRLKLLIPIIVIETIGTIMIDSFEAGANDFLKQPLDYTELFIRMKLHLGKFRREVEASPYSIHYTNLSIYLITQTVQLKGVDVELSAQEFKLLTYLASQPKRISNSKQLYEQIWGPGSYQDTRTVLVHISNIRRKLATDCDLPPYIQTIRGVGYKFHEYYL